MPGAAWGLTVTLAAMGNRLLLDVREKLRLLTGHDAAEDSAWHATEPMTRQDFGSQAAEYQAAGDAWAADSEFLDDADAGYMMPPATAIAVAVAAVGAGPEPEPGPHPAHPSLPAGLPAVVGRFIIKGQRAHDRLGLLADAWDPATNQPALVRYVRVAPGADAHALAAVRALSGWYHPNVATVHDAGTMPDGVYLAMDAPSGRSLQQALAAGWRPRSTLAARIVCQLAQALAEAHAKGVLHGDLQTDQIQLDDEGQPLLMGLGVAAIASASGRAGFEASAGLTCERLAPQALNGRAADAHSDVRALGLVLHALLALQPANGAGSAAEPQPAGLDNPPAPVGGQRRRVPSSLLAIADQAAALEPAQRFPSADALAAALSDWLDAHEKRKSRGQYADITVATPRRARRDGSRRARRRSSTARQMWAHGVRVALGVALLALAVMSRPLWPKIMAGLLPVAAPAVGVDAAASTKPAGEKAVSAAPGQAAWAPSAQDPQTAPGTQDAAGAHAAQDTQNTLAAQNAQNAQNTQLAQDALLRQQRDIAYAAKRVGLVALDVSPKADVLVNGVLAGTTPPMTQLKLPVGAQVITLRTEGFDPFVLSVNVRPDQPVELRHVFSK